MAEKKRQKRVLLLDSDTLGLAAGLSVAAAVTGLGLWRGQDILAVAVRAGWAFLGTYVVVFLLVRTILRTTIREMLERRRDEESAQREAAQADASQAKAGQAEGPPAEEETGER